MFSPVALKVGRIRSFYFFMFYSLIKYTKIKKEDAIMVKIGLNIKNGSKAFKPQAGDVVIFDGKDWYVTTKDDIFKEYQEKVDAKLMEVTNKLDAELEKIEQFKANISSQIVEISENVKKFIKLQGDK